jgi:CRP-like cAMP-binding protein
VIASERERFLQRVALLGDLDAEELRALAEVAQPVRFPDSALIFCEGEAGDCIYFVVKGSVPVFATDRNGDETVLAQTQGVRTRRRAVAVERRFRPSQREPSCL